MDGSDNWLQLKDAALLALRTTHSLVRGATPFLLMKGRNAKIPAFMGMEFPDDKLILSDKMRRDIFRRVKIALEENREKQKKHYDKGRKSVKFEVDELVWLQFSDGGKNDVKRIGPFRVVRKVSDEVYPHQRNNRRN
jgi:hypothetical protein